MKEDKMIEIEFYGSQRFLMIINLILWIIKIFNESTINQLKLNFMIPMNKHKF